MLRVVHQGKISMKLSQNVEDYLETIYLLKKRNSDVRVKAIASDLGITLPSVTEMIRKLTEKNLVTYKKYGPVDLTPKGKDVAKKVYAKHKLLVDFFISLGVDKKTAARDACIAEHVLSSKTLNKLKSFTKNRR